MKTLGQVLQEAIDRSDGGTRNHLVIIRDNLTISQLSEEPTTSTISCIVDRVSYQIFSKMHNCLFDRGDTI